MKTIDLTEFKEIPGYSRYLVSPSGEIWDAQQKRFIYCDSKGLIRLLGENSVKYLQLRNVIYSLFIEELHYTEKVVNISGDKQDNALNNLVKLSRTNSVGDKDIVYPKNIDRKNLIIRHRSMMYRCYNNSDYNEDKYSNYGDKGVMVDDSWKEYKNYAKWFIDNYIEGWVVDKDILGLFAEGVPSYSENSCVFIPPKLNAFFSSVTRGYGKESIRARRERKKYESSIMVDGICHYLSGDTEEDVIEQYCLLKNLHLEKLTWEMKKEHQYMLQEYPNTPE